MNKKNIFLSSIIISILLIVLFSQPWSVNWLDYGQARYYIMGASGLIGMVIMTWQVILGIRPMFAWFTKDFFWVNGLHKRLGIGTLMSLIFHPIASVISYGTSRLYVFSLDFSDTIEGRISVGKISFDLILIVLITSILSRKILSYRSRHWVHLLSYPAFIGVWFHGWFTGTMIAELPAMRGYRILLGGVLVISMIVRIACQYGYLKTTTTLKKQTKLTHDIYELKLQLPTSLPYQEGQFVYIQDRRGGESHPFTVLAYDKESDILIITYKVYGRFTNQLSELSEGSQLYIDGPYGVFMDDIAETQTPIVCIAAGIGITPFYELIQNYASTKQIKLLYLNKTKQDIVYQKELESHLSADGCTHILSREKTQEGKNQIVNTRITKEILQETVGNTLGSAQFYLCGGGAVIQEVTKMLKELGVADKNIDFEPFTM